MKTLQEQLVYAQGLFTIRKRQVEQHVRDKQWEPDLCQHELECMSAILATLEKIKMLGEVSEEMKAMFRKEHPPALCECCGEEIDKGTRCVNCAETN